MLLSALVLPHFATSITIFICLHKVVLVYPKRAVHIYKNIPLRKQHLSISITIMKTMASLSSPCLLAIHWTTPLQNPGVFFIPKQTNHKLHRTLKFHILTPKATGDKETKPKTKSVICTDCEGNGAIQCSQCKGVGVNPEDFFNGQFKAGDSCWLCGGRKEMLCGNCNGAGFVGGFLSGFEDS